MLPRATILVLGLFSLFLCAAPSGVSSPPASESRKLKWTMINVNSGLAQGDSNWIEFPSGEDFLIDAGDPNQTLIEFLTSRKVKKFKATLITHPHTDHYNGLLSIIKAGIDPGTVYFRMPNQELCEAEGKWGCQYPDVVDLTVQLKKRGVKVLPFFSGQVIHSEGNASLKILEVFDGLGPPVGRTTINGMSPLIRLANGKTVALITADMDEPTGDYLFKQGKLPKAELLQAPHHGGVSLPNAKFFDAIAPKIILVPTTRRLWEDARTEFLRKYLKARKTQHFVGGIDGHVSAILEESSFQIESEGH